MKRKLISMFLIIVLLQPLYSFVFAQNITNEENIQNITETTKRSNQKN